ncbi:titin homolog [Pecten maximus]|uniref:titin homolog n=1 Tax=Pecten maximus TaxID=6579 RepID=UPI0014581138|nr:titin homolog [Pecten maximus]XP_033745136.1 titin homolog [Pecten maximus]
MSHLEELHFKGFSPLRTPDVLKFVKQKHKKKHKEHVGKNIQHEISDSETEITKDILKLASKVSGKLSENRKDKFAFRSSDLPVDIDITPERKKRLDARLHGENHEGVSVETSSQLNNSQSETQSVRMQQKSPKKHRKSKSHTMSDNEDGDVQKVSDDGAEEEEVCGSPSILSGMDNTLNKSSSRKKHKSHKKHKKRKHNDDSRNISESLTEQGDHDKSDVIDSSPEKPIKVKLFDKSSPQEMVDESPLKQLGRSPQKQLDKSPRKQSDKSPRKQSDKSPPKKVEVSPKKQIDRSPKQKETPGMTRYQNGNQSIVSDSEETESSDNLVTNQLLKYKVPENFNSSSQTTKSLLSTEVVQGSELWLIKAPSDFDVRRLSGQEISLDKISHLQTKDVVMDTFPVPGDISGVSYCPILPSKKSGRMSVGTKFCGQLHVTTSVDVPSLPKVKVPPPRHIATPDNLKPRYIPFGANILVNSHSKTQVKHKKAKKRRHSVDETDDVPVQHKKKKKKHKH